jgi:ABC-type transport system involved in multi-copper enzyme maturation permease subunit
MRSVAWADSRQRLLAIFRQPALALRRPQIVAAWRPLPLIRVLAWELRRFRSNRLFWLQALGFFSLVVLLRWTQSMPVGVGTPTANGPPTTNAFVAGTSAWGLLVTLPIDAIVLLLLLPFVMTDGVTRDRSRRTHELLMATPLPGWAYVWGRYLSGLLVSLGLALLFLAAILGIGWVQHLTIADYPAPELGTILLLWGGLVVPAAVLVGSLSFALGTAFPRRSTLVKIVILVAWFIGSRPSPSQRSLPAWYVAWDPTGRATAQAASSMYQATFDTLSQAATNAAQLQHLINAVENKVPDVSAWLLPHLIEALVGVLLVTLVVFAFHRFRAAFAA